MQNSKTLMPHKKEGCPYLQAHKQVLWFDISVDDMLLMAVYQSPCKRSNILHKK
jgi:hypothetical protein